MSPESAARPVLTITIINEHNPEMTFRYPCILDTGADHCILPSSLSPLLGHDLKKGKLVEIGGIGGRISGWLHSNRIRFGKESVKCDFYLCDNYNYWGLLGHCGFFSQYAVLFDTRKKWFEIYK